jgi:hypothetical protein
VGGAGYLAYLVVMVRYFPRGTQTDEGLNNVRLIARGASRCAGGEDAIVDADGGPGSPTWRGLPASSAAIPPSLADVAGRKYQSSLSEWSGEPWRCMQVEVSAPQYYQYRWTRKSDTEGIAEASADLDGDGKADRYVAQEVHCAADGARVRCNPSSPPIVE